MFNPTLVVLAAGIGSRYGGLKQIDPVGPNGELIIDYSVYDALRSGFGRVVFVINSKIEGEFRQRVGRTIEQQTDTVYVIQDLYDVPTGFGVPPDRRKPWGTAHATYACRDVLDSSFAVINADDFYGQAAYQSLYHHLRHAQDRDGMHDYCMVGYELEKTLTDHGHVSRGVCQVDEAGLLVSIRERTRIQAFDDGIKYTEDGQSWIKIPSGSTASMNIWGFTPSLITELLTLLPRFLETNRNGLATAEFYLPVAVGQLRAEGKAQVTVLPTSEQWFGVTYQKDKPRVKGAIQAMIKSGIYPDSLWG